MQKINSFIFSSFIYLISCSLVFAQTAALLPNALQQYFDNNGNPLTSGTVGFYIPSTLTLKPVWQDAAETTPWTNPITLDAGGKPPGSAAGIYGQGTYRQIVKDASNNLIWDAVTSAAGTNSISSTGDGDLVGTIKPWAGIQAPNQYLFANGQQLSRATFSALFTSITQSLGVICTSSSNILTGIGDTTQIRIGSSVETSCVIPGTTVVSKTSSSVTLTNPSSVSINTFAVFFPFGNGDGSTTFTLPDLRGNVIAGRPNMGGILASNLTTSCPNIAAQGALCGTQSDTLIQNNLPSVNFNVTGISIIPFQSTITASSPASGTGGTSVVTTSGGGTFNYAANTTSPVLTNLGGGTQGFAASGGNAQPFSIVQPTISMNYIIKVTPDTNSAIANGVTDISGMTGSIACGGGLTCTGNVINIASGAASVAGSSTQVQFNSSGIFGASANLTWVSPKLTIGATGTSGQLAFAGSGSGSLTQTVQATAGTPTITWGNTSGTPAVSATAPLSITTTTGVVACITCGITTNPLSQFASTTSAQLLATLSNPTGSGLSVFNTSPTLITPTLGAALATSINGLTLTSSTGTLTIANAKTATINNSLTLAGTDSTTLTFQGTDTYVGRATTDILTNKTFDTAGTGNSFKINGTGITSIGGTTSKVGTVAGSLTSGHCVSIDANANFVDAGGACTTGGGGGTVNAGTAGQLAYYGTSTAVVSGNPNATISAGALTLGVAGSVQGSLNLAGVTSGTTVLAVAAAASGTLTLPSATDTIVGRATTDTLTNKTLTAPVIATIVNSGTLTLPTSTDTLVARATTDTLTNKTIDTATSTVKIAGTSITAISGNTSKVATTSGALTNNDCVNIDASGNLIDAGNPCLNSYTAPGSGAVSQTIASRLANELWAKDFGAVCNSVTNDQPAFANMIAAGIALNISTHFTGRCAIASAIPINGTVSFEGSSKGNAILLVPVGQSAIILNGATYSRIEHMEIFNNGACASTGGVFAISATAHSDYITVDDVLIFCTENGISFSASGGFSITNTLIGLGNQSAVGVLIGTGTVDSANGRINNSIITNAATPPSTSIAVLCESCAGLRYLNNDINGVWLIGLEVSAINVQDGDLFVAHNSIEGIYGSAVNISRTDVVSFFGDYTFVNNEFSGPECFVINTDATGPWILAVNIVGNICNGASANPAWFIDSVWGLTFTGNTTWAAAGVANARIGSQVNFAVLGPNSCIANPTTNTFKYTGASACGASSNSATNSTVYPPY